MNPNLHNQRVVSSPLVNSLKGRRSVGVLASLFLLTVGSMLLAKSNHASNVPQQVPQVILSGVVTETNGSPVSDVLIFVDGTRRTSVVTGSDGSYSLSVPQGGNYVVTPYRSAITFRPGSLKFDVVNNNQGNINFVATRTGTFKVSGAVLDTTGQALSDVVIGISTSPQILTVSGPTGIFSFDSLTAGAPYTLTPVRPGYTFDPPQLAINNLNRNISNVKFVAVSSDKVRISGAIVSNLGETLSDVIVGLVGSENRLSTTTGEGTFGFTVPSGGTFTIAPAREGYTFNPPSLTFNNLTRNQSSVNFVGTQVAMVSISGLVFNAGGAPMTDVPMMITGSASGSQPTGPAGSYQFSVLATGNYTVVPVVPGMAFLPPSRTFTNVTSDQMEVNFVASGNPTAGNTSEKVFENMQVNLPSPTPEESPSPSPSPSPHERVTPTPNLGPTPKPNAEASPKTEEKPATPPGPSKPATEEKAAATTTAKSTSNKRGKSRRRGTRRTTGSRRTRKSAATKKPPAKKKTTKKQH